MRTIILAASMLSAAWVAPAAAQYYPDGPSSNSTAVTTTVPLDNRSPYYGAGTLGAAPAAGYVQPNFTQDYGSLFKTQGDIAYATGGVGAEELALIKSHANDYNLRVLSTLSDGAYLGDYALRVTNTNGATIFEQTADGPYFYVKLPPGTYRVEALPPGREAKSQKVTLSASAGKPVNFSWKGSAAAPGNVLEDSNR